MMQISLPDGRHYPIHLGKELLHEAEQLIGDSRCIIVTDQNVAPHWLSQLQGHLPHCLGSIVLPAGEGTKSFAHLERLLASILELQPDRQTTLIALGGGVVGDITGFTASILLRGVPFVQIPTSLLAQVDSSVGGKTGINSPTGKNLIGSFYQPQAVVIDTHTLTTLPDRELKAGLAEVIKAACIAGEDFFIWLEAHMPKLLARDEESLKQAIQRAITLKADIVMQDEREAGKRALLNLGHTFGHALEAEFGYDGRLIHGEAVAIGMVMAFEYSNKQKLCTAVAAARVRELVKAAGLPYRIEKWPGSQLLMQHMRQDKKAVGGQMTLILSRGIGNCFIEKQVDEASVVDFLSHYCQK